MLPDSTVLQSTLLKLLADPQADRRIGRGVHYLAKDLKGKLSSTQQPTSQKIMEVVWSLIAQGLAYIDYSQPAPENWQLCLTESGSAAARDANINPDNSGDYLKQLKERIPSISDVVKQYACEAIMTYNARCYLSSAVMLGVASEAAFIEMASSFGKWLTESQRQKFFEILKNSKCNYIQKFAEFRKRIEPIRAKLPEGLSEGMALTLDSVLDLLRIYRNDAGHPTGKKVSREDDFISLQMFVRYLEKLYAFKSFFDTEGVGSVKNEGSNLKTPK